MLHDLELCGAHRFCQGTVVCVCCDLSCIRVYYHFCSQLSGDLELRELRKRLLETEAQMSRILQAMEGVNSKVAQTTAAFTVSALLSVTHNG